LANLRGSAAVTHGGNSEELIRPLAERYSAELQTQYPHEPEWWHKLNGRRLAKIERRAVYCEGRREIHQRRGTVIAAAVDEEALTKAFLADVDRAEQRNRDRGSKGGSSLAAIEAEFAEDGGGND
jgi:hypothetical protein